MATVAEAIQAAHESGIVHRDLKPANVLLTADGRPKVTDFGLAGRLGHHVPMVDNGELTLSGAPMGTPNYMSPEQARGDKDAIGPATDVYALGAVLYECLTGRPPFRAENAAATLQQVLDNEPLPPARLNPGIPRNLDTICLKCLHKEPLRRYASAAALADDLRRFERGEPIVARPVGRLERAAKWSRRRPTAATLLATMLLLLAGVTAAAVWYVGDRNRLRHEDSLRDAEVHNRARQVNREALAALDRAALHLTDLRTKVDDPVQVREAAQRPRPMAVTVGTGPARLPACPVGVCQQRGAGHRGGAEPLPESAGDVVERGGQLPTGDGAGRHRRRRVH